MLAVCFALNLSKESGEGGGDEYKRRERAGERERKRREGERRREGETFRQTDR